VQKTGSWSSCEVRWTGLRWYSHRALETERLSPGPVRLQDEFDQIYGKYHHVRLDEKQSTLPTYQRNIGEQFGKVIALDEGCQVYLGLPSEVFRIYVMA
jgi:hypothetical protein